VHILLPENPQCLFSVAGREDPKPAGLKHAAQGLTKPRVVVGNQK
jgi:hypothetical protein